MGDSTSTWVGDEQTALEHESFPSWSHSCLCFSLASRPECSHLFHLKNQLSFSTAGEKS